MRHPNQRHGITLIFVVSLIVLFLLMATAFVVLATDFFRSARHRGIQEGRTFDGQPMVDRAFYDLLREPSLHDVNSPLRGHSLLGDIYGYGFRALVRNSSLHPSQQFIAVNVDIGSAEYLLDDQAVPVPLAAEWGGLVLTFVSGPARGLSTRIIDHQVAGTLQQLLLQPLWKETQFSLAQAAELSNSRIIVNGRPFSGTGAGLFNPQQPPNRAALNATALQPNQRGRSRNDLIGRNGTIGADGGMLGYLAKVNPDGTLVANHAATNESYDTFDFQNMFLAGVRPNGSILEASFFRPQLLSNPRGDFRAVRTSESNLILQSLLVDNMNNGFPDGIWIDTGLTPMVASDGTRFKPLVSYTVVDLDGRINLNAHGNQFDLDRQMSEILLLPSSVLGGRPDSVNLHRGVGYGPPEVSLRPLLGPAWDWVLNGRDGVPGRYGIDGKPGMPNLRDPWSAYKLIGYPDLSFFQPVPGTVAGSFGSVMDIHGRFSIGYPDDVKEEGVPVHLPTANVGLSYLDTEMVDSAYEMSFADANLAGPVNPYDTPFTLQELEKVIRRFDPDANMLTERLYRLGFANFSGAQTAAHSVTTSSFEVPTLFENLPSKLARVLAANNPALSSAQIQQQVQMMLPAEVLRGLPMDVNRVFGDGIDNNGNGVVDEPGEVNVLTHPSGANVSFANSHVRAEFARHLYIIALLATEKFDPNGFALPTSGTVLEYRKMMAQWAINVVDFRDRDSIMTPFVVDLNPWDGWDVQDDLTNPSMLNGRDPRYRAVVWGAERPELLITEVLATHDRRTQDLNIDSSGKTVIDDEDPDDDFDSHLVPNVSFFVELYNPWVINEANQYRPPEFYDAGLNGVDLQRRIDGSPVWRLIVTQVGQNDLDPDDLSSGFQSARRIYFTRPSDDSGLEVYFPEDNLMIPSIQPGLHAVIGSAGVKLGPDYQNFFGRWIDPIQVMNETRQLTLSPSQRLLKVVNWNEANGQMELENREVINLPIGLNDTGIERNLGVSDPLQGYAGLQHNGFDVMMTPEEDGFKYTIDIPEPETDFAFDMPVDRMLDPDHYDTYLASDGIVTGYRVVHLQRLANPLQRFHPLTNPYRTIDSSAIDLVVFNGVETQDDPNNLARPIRFGSYERRAIINAAGEPTQDISQNQHRLLFRNGRQGLRFGEGEELAPTPSQAQSDAEILGTDGHIFSRNLKESLGLINHAYRNATGEGDGAEQLPFAWLTWNNRPYASHLELANVPYTSSSNLTRFFDAADEQLNIYEGRASNGGQQLNADQNHGAINANFSPNSRSFAGQFSHLLNLFSDQLDQANLSRGLHGVFDYLEVPSRFVGTETFLNPSFFASDLAQPAALRVPNERLSHYRYPGKININTVVDSRVWDGLMRNYATPLGGGNAISFPQWEESRHGTGGFRYGNPYRSTLASNWVPLNGLVREPVECGLFRSTERMGRKVPLFDYQSVAVHNHTQRAAYFRYDARQRLGNLVTGRSSLFAIWISVGYFETDAQGSLINQTQGGREITDGNGNPIRHRGFFLVDRSIPVAFEPGQNHNVDRTVLIRRYMD